MEHESRIKNVFEQYINVVSPYIVQLEVLDSEYPVEILNEIRAVMTHYARYELSEDTSIRETNLSKMEGHIKRATLDCFKYLCVSLDDEFKNTVALYKDVDMSLVDNGDFLPEINKKLRNAQDTYKTAKTEEIKLSEENTDSIYTLYENAYNAYAELIITLNSALDKLDGLKLRAMRKKKFNNIGFVVGIAGTIITAISIVVTIFTLV